MKNIKPLTSKPYYNFVFFILSLIILINIFHFYGTSVYEDWAHGSLFVWLHCVWKFDSVGAVNYTFSYLIPIVALWFIWQEKDKIKMAKWQNYPLGIIILSIFLFLHGIALRAQLPHISAFSFIGSAWALALSFGGKPIGRALIFPTIYMTLAIPLSFIEKITFPLRHIASKLAVLTLNGLAIPVVNVGTAICDTNGKFQLDVADPCSGIRSLLALMALSLAFAKLSKLNNAGKTILFLSFLPVAIIANIIRIILLVLVTKFFGTEIAMGFYHDISGYIIFIIATILLFFIEHNLKTKFNIDKTKLASTKIIVNKIQSEKYKYTNITVFIILIFAFPYSRNMENISIIKKAPIKMQLPKIVAGWKGQRIYYSNSNTISRAILESETKEAGIDPITGEELSSASYQERIGLPSDTEIIKSIYTNNTGDELFVTLVLSGETRGSIHRPQWCISAQGYNIIATSFPCYRNYGDRKVALLELETSNKKNKSFFCYWFIGQNHSTPYHTSRVLHMASDRIIKGHATRWAYISIFGKMSPHIRKLIPSFVDSIETRLMLNNDNKKISSTK